MALIKEARLAMALGRLQGFAAAIRRCCPECFGQPAMGCGTCTQIDKVDLRISRLSVKLRKWSDSIFAVEDRRVIHDYSQWSTWDLLKLRIDLLNNPATESIDRPQDALDDIDTELALRLKTYWRGVVP